MSNEHDYDESDDELDDESDIDEGPDSVVIQEGCGDFVDAVGAFSRTSSRGTKVIGTSLKNGQFYGMVVAVEEYDEDSEDEDDDGVDWDERKHWLSILHIFDQNGNYVHTHYDEAGTSAEGEDDVIARAHSKLNDAIDELLVDHSPADVEVETFSADLEMSWGESIEVGLIEDDDVVNIEPTNAYLVEPWDGTYNIYEN